ncbi:hypothetical protein HNR12_001522 [Streptomonospora nanhaiensis]|uniref:Uncharacterized protein n=1 Tax=Streptomonospora nanhaiensis TaxID=1323731 RepID=A0A853BKJ4_9ACTN|nr:hypothetical protein [Streptomonospora nanhaiensis]
MAPAAVPPRTPTTSASREGAARFPGLLDLVAAWTPEEP